MANSSHIYTCHRFPQHPNITTSGVAHRRTLFLSMTLTCATVTF